MPMYKAKYISKSQGCLCIKRTPSPPPYKSIKETTKLLELTDESSSFGHYVKGDETEVPTTDVLVNVTIQTTLYEKVVIILKTIKGKLLLIIPSSCFQ